MALLVLFAILGIITNIVVNCTKQTYCSLGRLMIKFLSETMAGSFRLYILLAATSALTYSQQSVSQNELKEKPTITVWIDGTTNFKKNPIGVFKGPDVQPENALLPFSSPKLSEKQRNLGTLLSTNNHTACCPEHLYIFQWKRTLSSEERKKAANQLRSSLNALTEQYKKIYQCAPNIDIITHSHGGNVALNLAATEDQSRPPLSVNKLILLACPVQDKTEQFIHNPMFKKIYAIYSKSDWVQVIDPQGIRRPFSAKTILSRRSFESSPNIIQTAIKIDGKDPGHHDFKGAPFIKNLSMIIKEMSSWPHSPQSQELNIDNPSLIPESTTPAPAQLQGR